MKHLYEKLLNGALIKRQVSVFVFFMLNIHIQINSY